MKRFCLLALAAALVLSMAACSKQESSVGVIGGEDSIISGEGTITPAQPGAGDAQGDAEASSQAGWQEVPAAEYDAYLKKYLVPYGSLKFFEGDWTDAATLGADWIVTFTLQKNFNAFHSTLDYGAVFGEEFTYLQVPEAWFDENYGLVYPQDLVENTAIEYFGAEQALLRTAKAYVPSKSGYAAPLQQGDATEAVQELLPQVTSIKRNGTRAEITFTLSPCDAAGKLTEGTVTTRVMTVEDRAESFLYVSVTAG